MATIEKFEDIESWKSARILTKEIYSLTRKGEFAKDFGLRDQIRRAAVSIMSNIAEGFERGGNKEFAQFLATAKGSAGEVRAQLYVALDAAYISEAEFEKYCRMCLETSRLISAFLTYLTKSELRGHKFK